MLLDLVKDPEFQVLMERALRDTLAFFLEREQPFGILCHLDDVSFEPPLPEEIAGSLKDLTLFMIAGYTLESCELSEHMISFEAGFGPQNFGSVVSMPIISIMQILVDETPVMLNMARPMETRPPAAPDDDGVKRSLQSFLNNPENRKFLK
jgi:hypothetical protein